MPTAQLEAPQMHYWNSSRVLDFEPTIYYSFFFPYVVFLLLFCHIIEACRAYSVVPVAYADIR